MARIPGDRAHAVEVERLPVKDVIRQTPLRATPPDIALTAANKPRLHPRFFHHALDETDESQ